MSKPNPYVASVLFQQPEYSSLGSIFNKYKFWLSLSLVYQAIVKEASPFVWMSVYCFAKSFLAHITMASIFP